MSPGFAKAWELYGHWLEKAGRPMEGMIRPKAPIELSPNTPGRGKLRVEVEGAFKAHRLENVRQGIHGVSGKKRGVSAKTQKPGGQ
jgi:hypothetical protein